MNQRYTSWIRWCAGFALVAVQITNTNAFADEAEPVEQQQVVAAAIVVPAANAVPAEPAEQEVCTETKAATVAKPSSTAKKLLGLFFASDEQSADEGQFPATHQQVALLKVTPDVAEGEQQAAQGWGVKSFCLDSNDNLLVAVGDAEAGQLQLLNSKGERQQTWSLPIVPEAVNVHPDGNYLVAGAGKIYKLDANGKVLQEAASPLAAQMEAQKDEIRKEIVEQLKMTAKMMVQQKAMFQQQLDNIVSQAAKRLPREDRDEYMLLQKRIAKLSKTDESQLSLEQQNALALRKVLFRMHQANVEKQLTEQEQQLKDIFEQQLVQAEEYAAQENSEPSDEQIESSLRSMIAYKSQIASISAAAGNVFIASGAAQGYGFDVWRFDENLENPEKVVTELRGCCGQMDVQACESGLYVAENSRHQVRQFAFDGKKVNEWGGRERDGVRGFSSCCNPMNVAFGPDGSVYTAESNSGRIKRYSAEGELMQLIGSVELVPGCKKVSIAVSQDHSRIYMLDITRNHIIVMEAKPEVQQVVSKEVAKKAS